MRRLLLVLRLVLAAVFLYAAWTKLRQPWTLLAVSIDSYGLLPERGVLAMARVLPWTELSLGLWLATGFALRFSSAFASGLLGVFYGVMLYAFAKGLGIDCGCFGVGEALSAGTLARDGALLAAALVVTIAAARQAPKTSADASLNSNSGSVNAGTSCNPVSR